MTTIHNESWRIIFIDGTSTVMDRHYESEGAVSEHDISDSIQVAFEYQDRAAFYRRDHPPILMAIPHNYNATVNQHNFMYRQPITAVNVDDLRATKRLKSDFSITREEVEEWTDTEIPPVPKETFWTDDMFWDEAGTALDEFFT